MMTPAWKSYWLEMTGIPTGAPEWFVAAVAILVVYAFVVLPSGALIAYFERKLGADLQARVGPNRAGPAGFFQPIADFVKLLQKNSRDEFNWRRELWLGVHTMALYSTIAVLPLGTASLLVDTDMSVFVPFWATLVLALGTMFLGLNQASIPGWFGGVRVASQALAGAFPALIAILTVGIKTGGFKWSVIAAAQGAAPWSWLIFSNPFQVIAFLVFVTSGLVLLGIPPLDGGVSIADIHGGVSSHLHGRKLSLFRLGRFYGFFLWSVISVVLFLGGWNMPESVFEAMKSSDSGWLLFFSELIILLSKTFFLMLSIVWIARVNPRSRMDQITDLAWRVLSPFGLFALLGTSLWTAWRLLS